MDMACMIKQCKMFHVLENMKSREYWNLVNIVEFMSFMTKLIIIVPGLLFGIHYWWLYIFALATSLTLIWTSTEKTLPTIILFNVAWSILALIYLIKHFWYTS